MKIAIIGTGIAGLGAAWLLHRQHEITVYEANPRAGGHSRTIDVPDGGARIPVDTGFIVYNEKNYPHLTGLFRHLGVETIDSDMSFGASIGPRGWLEYSSKSLFAQKANWARPAFYGMLRDIERFNRTALRHLDRAGDDPTLGDLLDRMGMGVWFRRYYLLAMGAAIWSCPAETMVDFPARTFLRFFENHGLLTVNGQPQWRTVKGGSRAYVARLTEPFRDRIRLGCAARRVTRGEGAVTVEDAHGVRQAFDHVIFACHADQALRLLDRSTDEECAVLGAFHYQSNRVVTHGDASFMPRRRACWSSWVYLSEQPDDRGQVVSLSYWMNQLQSLETERPVIVTLNPGRRPDAALTWDEHVFDHPIFTRDAIRAQGRIAAIQGNGNVWHCGAYQRYGFHEDGLLSAVAVAGRLGVAAPWS